MRIYPKGENVYDDLKELEYWLKQNAGEQADEWIEVVWRAQEKLNALRIQDTAPLEDNGSIVGRFVAALGHDFHTDYAPKVYPNWSDVTKALWGELESRMNEPQCLEFDREGCLSEINKERREQKTYTNRIDATTSYHCGIISGLDIAYKKIEEHTHGHETRDNEG